MPKITLRSDITLHYQQVGQGPDLVLLHGLTGNLAVWHLKIVPMLWDRFRVTTYDLRGHGYSQVTPTGYTPDDMATDLHDLLDALGIEQPSLVGHSYGGDTALYFALRYPERARAIVAIEPALPAMIYLRDRDDWEGWNYWNDVLERSGRTVPPDKRTDSEFLLRESLQVPKKWGPLQGLPRNPKPFLRLLEETTMPTDTLEVGSLTLDRLPEITAPVTLMCCESSAFIGTHRYLHEHLGDARSVVLPRTEWGHFGPLEQPELVAEEILRALCDDTAVPATAATSGSETTDAGPELPAMR
jgi:pimeloyl-ACP methyl ester carboxylesterase